MARRHTPYHQRIKDLGAQIVDRIGFDAALAFTSTEQEHRATRNAVGVYDVYGQGPVDLKGPDSEALLQRLTARDVARRTAGEGRVLYTSLLNEAGGMIDDLTIYRLGPEHFWLVATPSRADIVERLLCEHARDMRAYVTNIVPGTAYLSIQGPSSRALLSRLTEADLSSPGLPYFRFIHAEVAEVPMVLSRTGYSGELGYELYYSRDYAEHVWDAVLQTGADLGATPAGLGALRSVRIEKKYPLYGLDMNETTTPWEAGLGWTVDFDGRDFAGRDTLLRQRDEGVDRKLAGLALPDLSVDPPLPGSGLEFAGTAVGKVTSSDRGYALGRTLALGYVAPVVEEGSVVSLASSEGQTLSATVTFEPFYDPRGERLRS